MSCLLLSVDVAAAPCTPPVSGSDSYRRGDGRRGRTGADAGKHEALPGRFQMRKRQENVAVLEQRASAARDEEHASSGVTSPISG